MCNVEKNQSNNCEILMRIDHRCVNTLYIGKWRDLILNMAFDKDQENKCFEHEIVIIFLSINLDMCCVCSKEFLIQTILLSTHNTCFG